MVLVTGDFPRVDLHKKADKGVLGEHIRGYGIQMAKQWEVDYVVAEEWDDEALDE